VAETLDFIKKVTEKRKEPPHKLLSINYIQALPGTPVYEYAREKGQIGKSLEEEEKYLNRISDMDANDDGKFINFTNEDNFTVQSWRYKILFEAEAHWYRCRRWMEENKLSPVGTKLEDKDYYTQGGYFNLKSVIHNPFFYRYGYFLRHLYYAANVLAKSLLRQPFHLFCEHVIEYIVVRWRKHQALKEYRSLREIAKDFPKPVSSSEQSMLPLRIGR